MPPRCRIRLSENRKRQFRQRANIDRDDVELLCAIHLDRPAEHAEARIVDHELDVDAGGIEGFLDPVAGIGLFEIAGNHDRARRGQPR